MTRPLDTSGLPGLPPVDLAGLDVALSEDLGFAPVDDAVRALFRERAGRFAAGFRRASRHDPEMADADRCFEVLRAVGFLAAHKAIYESRPEMLGPNVAANVALGLAMSAADVAWASVVHSRIYRNFLRFMAGHDVLICPAAAVSPFRKGTLYVSEVNGKPLDTYVSWLALAYGLTLTGHPVVALPCGLDASGMPFGLQLVGRRGRDVELLAIAAALEAHLQSLPECRRPLPDLERLAAAPPRAR